MNWKRVAITAALALAACTSASQRASDAMARGQDLMNSGQYSAAAEQFDYAVRLRDDIPELWIARARNQIMMGNYGGAFGSYRNALDQDRSNREALDAVSQLSLAINDLNSADKYADQILALDPSNLNAQLVHGTAAFRRGRLDDASAIVDRILAQQPGNEAGLVLKSRVLQRRGDLKGAEATILPLFNSGGGGADLRRQLAAVYQATTDPDGMMRVAERDAEAQPKSPEAQLALARQQLLTGRLPAGGATLNAIHRAAPSDALRDNTVAMLIDADIPLNDLMAALRALPSVDVGLQIAAARYAIERGDPALGLRLLAPSTANDAVTAIGTVRHGPYALALARLGRLREAAARADAVLKVDANQPEALLARALAEIAGNNLDAALRDTRIVLRDNPDSGPATELLGRIYTLREQPYMTNKAIVEGYNANRNDPSVLALYTAKLAREGRASEALSIAQNYILRNPASVAAWNIRRQLCATVKDQACATRSAAIIARLRGSKVAIPAAAASELAAERDFRAMTLP